jgi:hypothetical protein
MEWIQVIGFAIVWIIGMVLLGKYRNRYRKNP